jgi:hypothetical protein
MCSEIPVVYYEVTTFRGFFWTEQRKLKEGSINAVALR